MDALNGVTFLSGANAEFIAELYSRYLEDPDAVDESWRQFFGDFADAAHLLGGNLAHRKDDAEPMKALLLLRV